MSSGDDASISDYRIGSEFHHNTQQKAAINPRWREHHRPLDMNDDLLPPFLIGDARTIIAAAPLESVATAQPVGERARISRSKCANVSQRWPHATRSRR